MAFNALHDDVRLEILDLLKENKQFGDNVSGIEVGDQRKYLNRYLPPTSQHISKKEFNGFREELVMVDEAYKKMLEVRNKLLVNNVRHKERAKRLYYEQHANQDMDEEREQVAASKRAFSKRFEML